MVVQKLWQFFYCHLTLVGVFASDREVEGVLLYGAGAVCHWLALAKVASGNSYKLCDMFASVMRHWLHNCFHCCSCIWLVPLLAASFCQSAPPAFADSI